MATTDTRSNRSTLASVATVAFERNGWDVVAIARLPEPDTAYGICAFVYTSPHEVEPSYGTAHWSASGLRTAFDWGHYNLGYDAAMRDFRERIERRR